MKINENFDNFNFEFLINDTFEVLNVVKDQCF